jgi:hypothetical protein
MLANTESLNALIQQAARDIATIASYRSFLETKEKIKPDEEGYIYHELHDFLSSAVAWLQTKQKSFNIGSKEISVYLAHSGEAETFSGVDLMYEIAEEQKFVVLQYKRAQNGVFKVDRQQMETLLEKFCYRLCWVRPWKRQHPRNISRLNGLCPAYYSLLDIEQQTVSIIPACHVESDYEQKAKGQRFSFRADDLEQLIPRQEFVTLFTHCWIGSSNMLNEMMGTESRERVLWDYCNTIPDLVIVAQESASG